jgi:diguanylate cyclase (GGDEF)-like protein
VSNDDPQGRLALLRAVLQRVSEGPSQLILNVLRDIAAASSADATLLLHATNDAAIVSFSTDAHYLGQRLSVPVKDALQHLGIRSVRVQTVPAPRGVWVLACISGQLSPILAVPAGSLDVLAMLLGMLIKAEEPSTRIDVLTDLPDRSATLERLREVIANVDRSSGEAAVLFLDLDNFKSINDTYGHTHGDAVLRTIARRMRQVLRLDEFIGRLGGDEFCVILPSIDRMSQAELAAQRLCEVVSDVHEGVTLSAGIALIPKHGNEVEQLLSRADAAMYRSKRSRSNYCVYDDNWTHDIEIKQLPALKSEPSAASDFIFSLQAIVNVRLGRVVGVEMLPRWLQPNHTVQQKMNALIRVGEEIKNIDAWALSHALRETARLSQESSVKQIHVNVRADNGRHVAQLVEVLENAAPRARAGVSLELAATRWDSLVVAAEALLPTGTNVGLDAFDVCEFSVPKLHKLNLSFIKFSASSMDRRAVQATVGLAQALGMDIIATHVEKETHRDSLRAIGIHLMQGFYFAPPMTSIDFKQWLVSKAATQQHSFKQRDSF